MPLIQDLQKLLGKENVLTDEETLKKYSRDASLFEVKPAVVVTPRTVEDIKKLVTYANKHAKKKVTLSVRSGGTCMSGGSLTESILIDINKYFNRIKNVGDHEATTQPGVFYRDFEKATLAKNLLMPSYPASKHICTVGGMVANNAGGEKTLEYGKTAQFVKRLKVVLADGNEYVLEPLTKTELDQKMEQQDFEGELYRQMFELVTKHADTIQKAKPKVSKNSSGFALWDIWDGTTFDLTKLFTGSQGTLGIITEITFRLITPKPHTKMLVMFLQDIKPLADIVQKVLKYHPESFESYDDHTLRLALKFLPRMIQRMGTGNVVSLALQFLPEMGMLLRGGLPHLILIAEFTGHDQTEVDERAKAAQAALRGLPVRTRLTRNKKESEKYWAIRRESFSLLREKVKDKHTAPFIDDMSILPKYLPEFLPRLDSILQQYDLTYTVAGHIGDGNFHIIPLMNLADPKQREIIPELSKRVFDLVFEYGGSMSGEHNDGMVRSAFLPKMFGRDMYQLFVETNRIFDPNDIFNPGKKVRSDWEYVLEHMIHE